MRRILPLLFVLLVLAPAARAGQACDPSPDVCRMMLTADECRLELCAEVGAPFQNFYIYAWVLPPSDGATHVDFDIEFPPSVTVYITLLNDAFLPTMFTPPGPPWSLAYMSCQTASHWVIRYEVFLVDLDPALVAIAPNGDTGLLAARTCAGGNPSVPMFPYNHFTINDPNGCGVIGTGPASWGAIKTLAGS